MEFEVCVELKPDVLDTQGRTIGTTIQKLGYDSVEQIRVGKRYIIKLQPDVEQPESQVKKIADEFLCNQVAEHYSLRKL